MNVWVKWGGLTVLNLVLMAFATVVLAGWSGLDGVFSGIEDGGSFILLVIVSMAIASGIVWLVRYGSNYHPLLVTVTAGLAVIALGGLYVALLSHMSFGFFKPIVLVAVAIAASYGTLQLADR